MQFVVRQGQQALLDAQAALVLLRKTRRRNRRRLRSCWVRPWLSPERRQSAIFLLKEDKSLASGLFLDLMNMRAQGVKVSNNPSSFSVISASPSPDFFFLSLPNLLLRLVYQQASPPQQPSPSISSVSWQCPCRKSSSSVEDRVFFKPFNYLLLLFSG